MFRINIGYLKAAQFFEADIRSSHVVDKELKTWLTHIVHQFISEKVAVGVTDSDRTLGMSRKMRDLSLTSIFGEAQSVFHVNINVVGTEDGVSHYNFQYWKNYTVAEELAANYITDIAVGADGSPWFNNANDISHYLLKQEINESPFQKRSAESKSQ